MPMTRIEVYRQVRLVITKTLAFSLENALRKLRVGEGLVDIRSDIGHILYK